MLDFTDPAGARVIQVEQYGKNFSERRPLLHDDGSIEMSKGPIEFRRARPSALTRLDRRGPARLRLRPPEEVKPPQGPAGGVADGGLPMFGNLRSSSTATDHDGRHRRSLGRTT